MMVRSPVHFNFSDYDNGTQFSVYVQQQEADTKSAARSTRT